MKVVALLALGLALLLSAALAVAALTGGAPAGCVNVAACDKVLRSRWAYVGPIPVSAVGAMTYAMILAPLLRSRAGPPTFWRSHVHPALCGVALWAILGFVLLQVAVLRSVCPACMAAHAAALVGLGAAWWGFDGARRRVAALAWGLLGAAGLAGLQATLPQPSRAVERTLPAAAVASPNREVSLHQGGFVFRAGELPGFGAGAADDAMLNLIDFACDHCRSQVRMLRRAGSALAPRLYFAVLPVPLKSPVQSAFPAV